MAPAFWKAAGELPSEARAENRASRLAASTSGSASRVASLPWNMSAQDGVLPAMRLAWFLGRATTTGDVASDRPAGQAFAGLVAFNVSTHALDSGIQTS